MRMLNPFIAYSGEDALKMLKQHIQDVMVLDLNMPGMNGTVVLLFMKKTYPTVNVIILTGHGDESDRMKLEKMGATGYFQKTVDIETLLETINRVKN